jgi:ArsR family transcriptional regulator, arsenate/arsenite/antimonite-responsive transcriptional repressor
MQSPIQLSKLLDHIDISRYDVSWQVGMYDSGATGGIMSKALASLDEGLRDPRQEQMSAPHALAALSALGQPTRLEIVRLLIRKEPKGLAAGEIANQLGCPQNTLSAHLTTLSRSNLVRGERDGRFIIYHANVEAMRSLLAFLVMDCCDGRPEVCGLGTKASSAACRPPKATRRRSRKT